MTREDAAIFEQQSGRFVRRVHRFFVFVFVSDVVVGKLYKIRNVEVPNLRPALYCLNGNVT